MIKKPLDLTKIWNRISKLESSATGYTSLDEMCLDLGQMFENACIYNEPASTLYKDALTLQRALFHKRDAILEQEAHLAGHASLAELDSLSAGFVSGQIEQLIETLLEGTLAYQDTEGRVLSESFLEIYDLVHRGAANNESSLLTFELIKRRCKERFYKRLDVFQEEVFELFNQVCVGSRKKKRRKIRLHIPNLNLFFVFVFLSLQSNQVRVNSYFELTAKSHPNPGANHPFKIHRFSQLYKDAYELQRYFIQKRDELCKNGELLLSGALNYKVSALDGYIAGVVGSSAQSFDESEALLVEERYQPLADKIASVAAGTEKAAAVCINEAHFYYVDRQVLAPHLPAEFASAVQQ